MPRITGIWAYIACDADESDEGIVGTTMPGSDAWLPLVGADAARMKSYRRVVQAIADASGKRIRLVRFTVREEIEVLTPKGKL